MVDSINNKYIVENLIGKGKFGQIFKGHIHKKNTAIAIKMEPSEGEMKSIKHEVTILNYLYKRGCRNIPYIYWYGKYKMDVCMVMNYFPGSLCNENISNIGRFTEGHRPGVKRNNDEERSSESLDTFMIKCIDILKNIHEHYVIHRDIKPQNFMFDEHGELHLIDFGLATVYVDDEHRHIECTGCSQSYILGTPKYISYHVHEGYLPSRRDDLISIGYLYLFLKYGSLPWFEGFVEPSFGEAAQNLDSTPRISCGNPVLNEIQSVTGTVDTSFNELHVLHPNNQFRKEKKDWTNISTYLCEIGENKIEKYLEYCYRLDFESEPNYSGLQQLFDTTIVN